jgi:hypothetical protein
MLTPLRRDLWEGTIGKGTAYYPLNKGQYDFDALGFEKKRRKSFDGSVKSTKVRQNDSQFRRF